MHLAKHAPNSGSGKRVTGAGSHAEGRQALPSNTQGGSRMRESRMSGFVRGAHSNMCPYRDPEFVLGGSECWRGAGRVEGVVSECHDSTLPRF